MFIDFSGKKYELEKGNPFLIVGIERQGKGVRQVRRTYFASSEEEAKDIAEKENVTVLSVTDLLKLT